MPRTNTTRVKAVLDTSLDAEHLTPFIDTANVFVTAHLGDSDLSSDLLREIETYIAAHLTTIRDMREESVSADGVSFKFEGKTGLGLDGSRYGQMAQALDTTATLARLGDDARMPWHVRVGSEQTNDTTRYNP